MSEETGKWIILLGLGITLVGLVIYLGGERLNWLGRLPGDIRIERENFKFYFPITTMILISILANLLIRLFRHFS